MIRAYTPLPKPPSAERERPEIVDAMIRAVQGCGALSSSEIVVFTRAVLPQAKPHDIRMLLKPPYFRLTDAGWVCTWRLPLPNRAGASRNGDNVGASGDSQPPRNGRF